VKIAVMPTYLAKCLEPTEVKVPSNEPKVVILAYRVIKELEFVSRAQIKIDEHPVIAYKKFEEFIEGCEIALLRTEHGKGFREVLVYRKKPPGNILIFTKPSTLKGVILLRKQEEGEREENIMFAHNLIRDRYPVDDEGLVFVGDIRFLTEDESIAGIGLETSNGVRYIMKSELKELIPRPYAIVKIEAEKSPPKKDEIKPAKEVSESRSKSSAKAPAKKPKKRSGKRKRRKLKKKR
jgi:hypothetical protein